MTIVYEDSMIREREREKYGKRRETVRALANEDIGKKGCEMEQSC